MSTETKQLLTSRLAVKSVDVEGRTFEGLASTWDLDLGNDVIKKGAFRQTLKDWRASGRTLPLLDSHNWFSVRDAVGRLLEAQETDDGLWTQWKIVPGADGDEILARLRPDDEGKSFVDSMSIGYVPVRYEIDEDSGVRTLKEVELHEVSLVLFPMNPSARIDASSVKERAALAVKSILDHCPEGVRCEVKQTMKDALDAAPEPSRQPSRPDDEPAPAPAPQTTPTAKAGDGEPPDFSLFDQLRLRRLASRTHSSRGYPT